MEAIQVKDKLLGTIAAMEDACRRAKYYAERIDEANIHATDLAFLVNQVHHEFVWAWANASTNVESSLMDIAREVE